MYMAGGNVGKQHAVPERTVQQQAKQGEWMLQLQLNRVSVQSGLLMNVALCLMSQQSTAALLLVVFVN